jgi:glycerophosphoryl diester phosphodiesterase
MAGAQIPEENWPLVVAHRGASAAYPENTLEAFEGAVAARADVVELDVRLTADGVPVVMHDLDVAVTTDGEGFVHTLTLAEVKRLDASKGKGPRTEVPTLDEALSLLTGRAGINIEIKNLPGEPSFDSPREAAAASAVEALDRASFEGTVLVSSFNWLAIERVRALRPEIPTGFLTTAAIDPEAASVYARSHGHTHVLPQAPALFALGEPFVHEAHEHGLRVGTWTVDDAEAIERLFSWGVDAVASNDPAMAVGVRDRFRGQRSG